jgi:hypothetical protein
MSDLKDFVVVATTRSDGADTGLEYWPGAVAASDAGSPAAAAPPAKKTAAAAAKDPEKPIRAKPQMVRLDENDPRFIDWRLKLGVLLKQELCPTPDGECSGMSSLC